MNSLKNYILQQVYNHSLTKDEAKEYLLELEKNNSKIGSKDIAIIGMSGKFPLADDLDQYWGTLLQERNCIRDFPKERYPMVDNFLKNFYMKELIQDDCLDVEGNIDIEYQHRGYLDSIDKFDAEFFGIAPREAKAMDPDQRIFLECAYEAIEDGGFSGQSIYGKKVGVFVGVDHIEEIKYKRVASSDPMVVTGTWPGVLAGRLSYIFDFKAPSMVIDTACSSGLVSVHQGCKAICNGECEMAICGGLSSFIYSPTVFSTQLKELESIETQDDMIRTFDNDAKGTTWGEGVGVVLLKPLDKALEDGDPIHAVIKGSAINNDGASNGLTAPNVDAQQQLLKDAWEDAGVEPESIQYIEAHGTGTVLGDPFEIKAMTNAFRSYTEKKQFCGVGSVKPNIGHLVGASGIASMIKVVKMLENKIMLPSINFDTPNKFINFIGSPIYINDKKRTWEKLDTPRRAGVNSFGFSGTNCHVVLEEAPSEANITKTKQSQHLDEVRIFTLSARKKELLKTLVDRTIETLENKETDIDSLCYTSNICRGHYGERIALIVKDSKDLISKLEYIKNTEYENLNRFGICYGSYRIVSESKQNREADEITESQQRKFTRMAEEKLTEYQENRDFLVAFELCGLYVKGAEVKWEKIYDGKQVKKFRLPFYPLEKKSYWYFEDKQDAYVLEKTAKMAAFVDRLSAKTMYGDIYTTKVSPLENWVLSDHVILGQNIIPGTTYVEMSCELMRQYYGTDIRIDNLIFYTPCITGKEETREIQSIVENKGDHYDITYMSCNEEGEWEKHAECSAYPAEASKIVLNLEDIRNKLKAQDGKAYIREESGETAISLGARWDNERTDTRGKTEVLCRMELHSDILSDLDNSFLHIAMFDNAINAISQDVGEGLYLPYFYKTMEFHEVMPAQFYSYIRLKIEKDDEELDTITYDVDLIKDDGTVFASVRDYSTKKVSMDAMAKIKSANSKMVDYSVRWVREDSNNTNEIPTEGITLVIGFDCEYTEKITNEIHSTGRKTVTAIVGDEYKKISGEKYIVGLSEKDFQELLQDIKDRTLDSIVYSAAIRDTAASSENELEKVIYENYFGIVNLIKTYLRTYFSKDIRFTAIGNLAYKIKDCDMVIPEQSVMSALMKSINIEYESVHCKYVDTDLETDVSYIVSEIISQDVTLNTAYRNNERYVTELYSVEVNKNAEDFVKEGGIYLITGGTGGIGLALAEKLSEKYCDIILANHSGFPEREAWDAVVKAEENQKQIRAIKTIRKIEERGSEVTIIKANVSKEEEVKALADKIRTEYKAVTGIFHCAGNAGDGMLINRSLERMRSVLEPKIKGTVYLKKYLQDLSPKFMLLFSSMLTVFGDVGQADYMSANTYMDSFADKEDTSAFRIKVVNWPAWKETGMAVDYGAVNTDSSIEPITTLEAMLTVSEILASEVTSVMPGRLNFTKIKKNKLFSKIKYDKSIDAKINAAKERPKEETKTSPKKVYQYNSEYTETENKLYQIWSDVLQVDKLDIYDSFSSLGGDSFLAIQLYKEMNREYPGVVEVSDIFTYPMISKMADYIDKRTGKKTDDKKRNTEDRLDQDISDLMSAVKDGSTSIEDAVNMLIRD